MKDKEARDAPACIDMFKAGDETEVNQNLLSDRVQRLAGQGLRRPGTLSISEVQEICGAVVAHSTLENHGKTSA